jgi:hypothetical protein
LNPEDPLPALRAELDQAIAMLPELGRTVRAHYDEFVSQGFDSHAALYLTAVWLKDNPTLTP